MRRTKIVATAGPAWDRSGVLDSMIEAGVDVVRLNASHADREELERRLAEVRAAGERQGRLIAVLLDLPGPKIRIGAVAEGVRLVRGEAFDLVADVGEGDAQRARVSYAGLADDVSAGDRILIDDGSIELFVRSVAPGRVATEVVTGGALSSHKGVNVPGVRLGVEGVTEADIELAAWGVGVGVDWLAQSFVRGPEDVERLRDSMGPAPLPIVAKVEKHEAVTALDGIVAAADAVMVARGDLGVETSPEEVPVVQRRLVEACRVAGKPVVVATQMLESMRTSPRPTRAEASDVATAVFQSADAVMLSAESSVGDYPVEAVRTMARIARTAEDSGSPDDGTARPAHGDDTTLAVSAAACELAEDLHAAAIVTATESGATARAVASNRPRTPVLAMTSKASVARRLALVWGLLPTIASEAASLEEMAETGRSRARELGLARAGERIVLTAGVGLNRPGTTDLVRVLEV